MGGGGWDYMILGTEKNMTYSDYFFHLLFLPSPFHHRMYQNSIIIELYNRNNSYIQFNFNFITGCAKKCIQE